MKNTKKHANAAPKIDFAFFASAPIESVMAQYDSQISGLSLEQVETIQEEHGLNIMKGKESETVWSRLFGALINPFNLILLVIASITFITDILLPVHKDYLTFSIILLLILSSSLISFIQSQSSSVAIDKLTKKINYTCHVYREGELVEIPHEELVPGDIVHLGAGDMLPGDMRFIYTKDTFIAQSALTGESTPVEKFSHTLAAGKYSLTDLDNIGFMGSNMISGSARAIVLATGDDTYIGQIAGSLGGTRAKNNFERGVESISGLLIRTMFLMVPLIFLINFFGKGDWFGSLIFAVSIAVGLTPEMLPVITNSALAAGAQKMAKEKVIVRNASAIQSFGAIDVLCTDKTGTLTEDKVVLEKYMDLNGNDDIRVLRHAFLNARFQTGMKNLIDIAIIQRTIKHKLQHIADSYQLVDEVPFDFARRRMSVVLQDPKGKRQLITKGAVEEIIGICSLIELDGQVYELDAKKLEIARQTYEKFNKQGLRMIAVAQKNDIPDSLHFSVADESNMVLIGFMGFLDPPKQSATPAIEALSAHSVRTVVLTGDSEGVAIKVCSEVGINTDEYFVGRDVEDMSDEKLCQVVETCNLFARLDPRQKERVIMALQKNGHIVGFLGDGINDAPALHQADVGISVDSAVDVAKETADIVLLEKDLMVLEKGVIAGRRTFGNIMKYIKMATSGNFGNIVSVIVASFFLPFLPMKPVQILTQNLLNDFAQMGMPFDRMDKEYLSKPRAWDISGVRRFMCWLGPVSSIFDILCYVILWHGMGYNSVEKAMYFQAGWFLFGTLSQILIIQMIRTEKIPFLESASSKELTFSTILISIVAIIVAFSDFAVGFDMAPLNLQFVPWLVLLLACYMLTVQLIKRVYIKRYGEFV